MLTKQSVAHGGIVAAAGTLYLMFAWMQPACSLAAKKADFPYKKGDVVVLAVPPVLGASGSFDWSGRAKRDFEVRLNGTTVEVLSPLLKMWHSDWRSMGFPMNSTATFHKYKTFEREGESTKFIEVTIRVGEQTDYRIFAPIDQPTAITELIAPAYARDSILSLAYEALGAKFFEGPLSVYGSDERLLLLKFAHMTANGTKIGHEEFKGLTYLAISLPPDGNVWNDLQVNRSKRIGELISAQLALLKVFAKLSIPHEVIGGLKLSQPSVHGTAPYYEDQTWEDVDAYFPLNIMLHFAAADITDQQLVSQSIILIEGDRIEIDLGDL